MEILFRGTPPSEREYVATCACCNSRIKFKQSEGNVTYDQRDGDFIRINCPVCTESISIDLNNFIKPGYQNI